MGKKYYYKAMDKDMKCLGFQFKVGETYTIDSEELELCSDKVFHFCEKLEDTIDYYNCPTDRHFLIEVLGNIVTKDSKSGSNKIRIIREISRDEIEEHIQDKISYEAEEFLALYSKKCNILKELLKSENKYIRRGVAKNLNTPVYLLEKLAKDIDGDVRRAVASNPNVPVYLLEDLVKDKCWKVRRVIAENLNTPIYILEKLTKDINFYVHVALVKNPNTPAHILEELAKEEDWIIRCLVIENPNTSLYVLERLAEDEYETINKKAQERLKEITQ